MVKQLKSNEPVVLLSKQTGVSVIPSDSLLTRLNYYDGKFLRAEDLQTEQRYLRSLVQLSNQAGGHGVAHGYDVMLSGGGDTLNVGPGLAIDPAGRVLLLPHTVPVNVRELIEFSKQVFKLKAAQKGVAGVFEDCEFASETPPDVTPQSGDLYLITISHLEAYCGQEDVYGQLCQEACTNSTDRPYIVEGLVIRAEKLSLETLLAHSKALMLMPKHLRSRVASAYFNDERNRINSLISKAGLESSLWCFGAQPAGDASVPIAVLARAGQSTLFLDAWTARRELIDTPARRYWQWRMAMRPWDVFLAHVLQFQCQLRDIFKNVPDPGAEDPCKDEMELLAEANLAIMQINEYFAQVSDKLASLDFGANAAAIKETLNVSQAQVVKYGQIQKKFEVVKESAYFDKFDHLLINGGIVELPSGGYLPVSPGSNVSVNQQVRKLLGDGVDLRFCIVRPDYVPHALEEVQHMERISLLEGLDDPNKKPEVDILVPGGELFESKLAPATGGFEADVTFTAPLLDLASHFLGSDSGLETDFDPKNMAGVQMNRTAVFQGAARAERLSSGGGAFHISTWMEFDVQPTRVILGKHDVEAERPAAASVHSSVEETERVANTTTTTESKEDSYELLKKVASQAIRYYVQKHKEGGAGAGAKVVGESPASADSTGSAQPMPPPPQPVNISPERKAFLTATGGKGQAAGLWFTMKSELNIFELKQNQKATLDLRGVMAVPGRDRQNYVDAWLHGELSVSESVNVGGERVVRGNMKVLASYDIQTGNNEVKKGTVVNVEVEAKLKKEGQGHTAMLTLKHVEARKGFGIVIKLGGDPLKVGAEISFFDTDEDVDEPVMYSNLLANPSVAQAGNPSHVKAMSGIQTIANAKGDPSFAANAAALLFPPPPPATEELTVRATLDWVLFRRRRTSQCCVEPQAPANVVRHYNVYQWPVRADASGMIPKIIEWIHSEFPTYTTDHLNKYFFPAGQVEFAGGASTVTDPSSLLSSWEASQPGEVLIYGGILSTGEALQEGEQLALARLANARQLLAGKIIADPQARFDILPAMPQFLAQQGVDGIILFATAEAKAQMVCHNVYLAREASILSRMHQLIMQGGIADVLKEVSALGAVNFPSGKPNMPDQVSLNNVRNTWIHHGVAAPTHALVVSPLNDNATANANMIQMESIKAALGNSGTSENSTVGSQAPLPGGCPAITIFAVKRG